MGSVKLLWVLCLLVGATASRRASAQANSASPPKPVVKVAADGTVTIPPETVPVSSFVEP